MGLFGLEKLFTREDSVIRDYKDYLKKNPQEQRTRANLVKAYLFKIGSYTKEHKTQLREIQEAEEEMKKILVSNEPITVDMAKLVETFAKTYLELGAKEKIVADIGWDVYQKVRDLNEKKRQGLLGAAENDTFGKIIPWYYNFCNRYKLDPMIDKGEIVGKPNYEIKLEEIVSGVRLQTA